MACTFPLLMLRVYTTQQSKANRHKRHYKKIAPKQNGNVTLAPPCTLILFHVVILAFVNSRLIRDRSIVSLAMVFNGSKKKPTLQHEKESIIFNCLKKNTYIKEYFFFCKIMVRIIISVFFLFFIMILKKACLCL